MVFLQVNIDSSIMCRRNIYNIALQPISDYSLKTFCLFNVVLLNVFAFNLFYDAPVICVHVAIASLTQGTQQNQLAKGEHLSVSFVGMCVVLRCAY